MPRVLAITRIDPDVLAQKPPFNCEVISQYQAFYSGELLSSLKERLAEFRISDEDVYYWVDPMIAEAKLKEIVYGAGGEFGPETAFLETSKDDELDAHISDLTHLHQDLTPSEIELIELRKDYQRKMQEQEAAAAYKREQDARKERELVAKHEVLNLKAKIAGYDSYEHQLSEERLLNEDAKKQGFQDLDHKIMYHKLGERKLREVIALDMKIVNLRDGISKYPDYKNPARNKELSEAEEALRIITLDYPFIANKLNSLK